MEDEKEYVSWEGVPFHVEGYFLNGDVKLVVCGTMKEFWKLKDKGISVGGRFPKRNLITITEAEVQPLLDKILK